MKKAFFITVLMGISFGLAAQDNSEPQKTITYHSTPSPDFPGALVFDYGINYFNKNSGLMDNKQWLSPTLNVYYMYNFKIGDNSRFFFNVGAGVGNEKYTFKESITFIDSNEMTTIGSLSKMSFFSNAENFLKSQFSVSYFDIPIEIRVYTKKKDYKKSFFLAVGGKIGVKFSAKTKVKYKEFGSTKKFKNKYHFNASTIRYGAIARIGYGAINAWGYMALNDFFKKDKIKGFKNPTTFSFGLSLSFF